MRGIRVLAFATLAAIPVAAATSVGAAPAGSSAAAVAADIGARSAPPIEVQHRGFGGGRGGIGGFRGGPRGGAIGGGFRGRGPALGGSRIPRGSISPGPGRWAGSPGRPGRPGGWRPGHGHHHGHHHRHFRPRGWWGVPYYGYYGPSYYYDDFYEYDEPRVYVDDDAVARCRARFRSFDARTGTYVTTSGKRRVCPYLR